MRDLQAMTKELSYLEAIREALFEEMQRDSKVFVLGEDVGAYGGAFGATQCLYDQFGEMRVIDTPISESAIIGISIGGPSSDPSCTSRLSPVTASKLTRSMRLGRR